MSQKQELGKGLKALLSNINKEEKKVPENFLKQETETWLIDINKIKPNPHQPRNTFEEESLDELSRSIQTYGLIQPITVRRLADQEYQIISGERRYRAALKAGIKSLPAYVRLANDQEILEMALVENIQREDLSPIEIAISYSRLMEECKLNQEQLSDRVGKKRSTISNYTRLLKLPPEIQNALRDRQLSMGHARVLAGIEDLMLQTQLYKDIQQKELSVRDAERLSHSISKTKGRKILNPKPSLQGPLIKALEDRISGILGTKAVIQRKESGEGQIIIKFNSDQTLNDIIDRLDD